MGGINEDPWWDSIHLCTRFLNTLGGFLYLPYEKHLGSQLSAVEHFFFWQGLLASRGTHQGLLEGMFQAPGRHPATAVTKSTIKEKVSVNINKTSSGWEAVLEIWVLWEQKEYEVILVECRNCSLSPGTESEWIQEQEDDTLNFNHIFSFPFKNVFKTRVKSICVNMRLNVSVDASFWDTPISNREVVIVKQCDFIRKETAKYKIIQYVHWNEKGISVSYGENAD